MRATLCFLASAALLAGCGPLPPRPPPLPEPVSAAPAPSPGMQPPEAAPPPSATEFEEGTAIAGFATALVGAPYHFGGADAGGFDCSGLALYVHEQVGLAIPRTAAEQLRAARPVPLTQLAPGDLVFFRIRSRHVNHVGVYTGEGRFVHAPHAGRAVTYADLSNGYYARHLASAGRFW
jgi:cell wall-associated NlpC family hydrolase